MKSNLSGFVASIVVAILVCPIPAKAQALDKVQVQLNDGDTVQRYTFTQSYKDNEVACTYSYYGASVSFANRTVGNVQTMSFSLPDMNPIVVPKQVELTSFRFSLGNRTDPFYPGVNYASPYSGTEKTTCFASINEYNPVHPTVPAGGYYNHMGQLRGQVRCMNLRYLYGSNRSTPVDALVNFSCPYAYY